LRRSCCFQPGSPYRKFRIFKVVRNHTCKSTYMKLFLPVIIFIFLATCCTKTYCQGKNEAGISFQIEKMPRLMEDIGPGATKTAQTKLTFSFGAWYERIFSKHSSGETGLKYRQAINEIIIPVPAAPNNVAFVHYFIIEKFLSLPVLYKYSSRIINLSAGPSLDYFLSWKEQKNKNPTVPLQSYKLFFDKKLSIGLLTSISKTVNLTKKIIIEPSIYYNTILSFKRSYYGISIAAKHRF
jgi:hypothetical protein